MIERGMPKLWAISKTILCECWAKINFLGAKNAELLLIFKTGKVEGPQPKKGLSIILPIVEFQIPNLGMLWILISVNLFIKKEGLKILKRIDSLSIKKLK